MKFRWNMIFLLLWMLLLLYSFILAPGSIEDSFTLLMEMMTDPGSVEPLVFSIFNLLGVWPMVYAAVILFEGRGKGLRSWPFVIGSFFTGAFSLLPYLGLRRPQIDFKGKKSFLLRVLDSRAYGIVLKLVGISLLAYGIGAGNWSTYMELFRTNMLVHVMTVDLMVVTLAFPCVMRDDMRRRGWHGIGRFLLFALLPLIGPLTYLWMRPHQEDAGQE
ncbi:MAG: DUF2834 domain-containing protein [Thermoplasmatota archaeon]